MSIRGKVALLGANGAIGRTLGPLLGSHAVPYRVVGRSYLGLQVRFHEQPIPEHFQWDLEEKSSIREACEGAGTVVYLVGPALWKFKEHLPLTERVLRGARECGVERLLLVSSNWSYGEPVRDRVDEAHPRAPGTVKGKIRREQEDRVLAAHVPGILATGILRMADLYGPLVEASHLWTLFQAAKRGGEAKVLGPTDRPHEFVYVPDAARTILDLLGCDAAWAGEASAWNLGGAGLTSIDAMAKFIFAAAGRPPSYAMPSKWKMHYVRAINPYIRELGEMQYLLDSPLLLDDSKLASLLGGLGKTPYADGVRQTLAVF